MKPQSWWNSSGVARKAAAQIDSRIGVEWSLPHWFQPGQTLKTTLQGFRNVTDAYTERGEVIAFDLTRRFRTTSYISEGLSATSSTVVDKETGAMFVDRFMSTAMHYPCNWLPFWIIWNKCSKRKSLICWLYIKPVLANLNIIC